MYCQTLENRFECIRINGSILNLPIANCLSFPIETSNLIEEKITRVRVSNKRMEIMIEKNRLGFGLE